MCFSRAQMVCLGLRNSNMDLKICSGITVMLLFTITPSQSLKPITLHELESSDGDRYIWPTRCEPTPVQLHGARSVWLPGVRLMRGGPYLFGMFCYTAVSIVKIKGWARRAAHEFHLICTRTLPLEHGVTQLFYPGSNHIYAVHVSIIRTSHDVGSNGCRHPNMFCVCELQLTENCDACQQLTILCLYVRCHHPYTLWRW